MDFELRDLRVQRLELKTLKLLDLNARFMRHEKFQRLVDNIRQNGKLTSAPLAWLTDDGEWEVLSGNHRTRAAMEAGLTHAFVLTTEDRLTENQRIAIQLSHNELAGEDDPTILAMLYDHIDNVDMKLYSGVDDKELGKLLDAVPLEPLSAPNLEFSAITLMFLPDEIEKLKAAFGEATQMANGEPFAVRMKDYDRFMDALAECADAANVKNTATAMLLMLEVFERHRQDLAAEWYDDDKEETNQKRAWVPISSVLGRATLPCKTAAILRRALDKAIVGGSVPKERPWLLLERLADER